MNIGFIEDTNLRGGTQIWVTEAICYFLERGETASVLAPEGSWIADECRKLGAIVTTYDYDRIITEDTTNKMIWGEALSTWDVAVCTVHPPRSSYHCAVFAGTVIREYGLNTVLLPKTGTIVPNYRREFYLPDESIRSRVIAITDFTRKYLIETYKIPADNVELIYQGTEIELFTPDPTRKAVAAKRYPVPEDSSPILACVGTFEERKGQVVLLHAVSQLAAGPLSNVHLILVGEGPDEQLLKEEVRALGLEKYVSIFPFTSEPIYVFESIDVLVLSSLNREGLPNVLLEAMSMEIPVVSSRLAGVPEIVENGATGYMVEPGDSQQLAEAINRLWSDKDRFVRMSENGRKLIVEKFDKQTQFAHFLAYFHKINQ